MRRARPIALAILVAIFVLTPSARSSAEPPGFAHAKVLTREVQVSSHFNFRLRVSCSPADGRLPCTGHVWVPTVKKFFFDAPLYLTPLSRRYRIKPGTEGVLKFHIRRFGHDLLERQRKLWVKPEFQLILGNSGEVDRAVLLRWKPPKK